jgi:hypothetical protein
LSDQRRGFVGVEQRLHEGGLAVEHRDQDVGRTVRDGEVDVVGGGRLAGEQSGRCTNLDIVPGRSEFAARVPRGARRARKEGLLGIDPVGATSDEEESRQYEQKPQ